MIPISIIYNFVNLICTILSWTILIEAVLSYVPGMRNNKYYDILLEINNPVLEPFRRLQYRLLGNSMLDFSPIFALVALNFIKNAFRVLL